MTKLPGLEESFDNERAEELLSLAVGKVTYTSDILKKSMYDFDLETPEGIERLMALLPIMDPDILKEIITTIWPGYPTDVDARRHRLEIKGYLKDYLESMDDEENAGEQLEGAGSEESQGAFGGVEEPPEDAQAEPGPESTLDSVSGASESPDETGADRQI